MLEIKPCAGNSKIKQLKDIELYIDYHKEGNKFIIDNIKQPKKDEIFLHELLKGNNSKYIILLSNIILTYLYKDPNSLKEIPLIKLLSVLGITNSNYKASNNYRKELSQLYNIQLASIYYFYDTTRNEFKRIIERCLNNLQNRSVLFWSKCIMIIENDKKMHKANEEEKELILNTQKEALEFIGVESIRDVMRSKKLRNKFNDIISKELNFKYFFAYDITIGKKAIKIEYENILKNKQDLNTNILKRVNKIFTGDNFSNSIIDYQFLIEFLIDINFEDESLQDLLIEKHKSNIHCYNIQIEEKELEYKESLKNIENTYLDTYDN